jgi:hypothetical protein
MSCSICTIDFLSVGGLRSMFSGSVDEITAAPGTGIKDLK